MRYTDKIIDWMIDHMGPSSTAGIISAMIGLLLSLTPIYQWQAAIGLGLGVAAGNFLARWALGIRAK